MKIIEFIKNNNISVDLIAEKTGYSTSHIQKILAGTRRISEAFRIAFQKNFQNDESVLEIPELPVPGTDINRGRWAVVGQSTIYGNGIISWNVSKNDAKRNMKFINRNGYGKTVTVSKTRALRPG